MTEQQIDRDTLRRKAKDRYTIFIRPDDLLALLDQLDQADARIRHLEATAQVLVKEALDAENARDENRRGKAEAEARIKAVENLHVYENRPVEKWARGHRYTGEHCAHDGEQWPCRTIRALDGV